MEKDLKHKLTIILDEIRELIQKQKAIEETYGSALKDLQRAGKYDELQNLEKQTGELYRKGVSIAKALLLLKKRGATIREELLEAYNKDGLFANAPGSNNAWEDVLIGEAYDTDFYPWKHMRGLEAALRVALQ